MDDVVFMVNPTAASGRAERTWARLRADSPELGRARCIMETDGVEAQAALREALDDRVRRLIVVGGDGSLHLAASTLLDAGHSAALGLVPAGSGSDTARGWQLPHKPAAALERALYGPARCVDAVRLRQPSGEAWVVNIASAGISGRVAAGVNRLQVRRAGTYLWQTFKALARYADSACRIELDGAPWFEGPFLLCAVANGPVFARGMWIAPNAVPDDGLLDVVLVPAVFRPRILPWIPSLYTGRHLRAPFVQVARAQTVRVEPFGAAPPMEADGETIAPAAAEFEIVAKALRVIK